MLHDPEHAAAALYDGGWRAADREQLLSEPEYDLTADEADDICAELERMDHYDNN